MRIISGKYKSRRIMAPKKLPVRPTTDMAKESLFNILNNSFYFSNISVIELFAGTGNISYEFASRGTQEITAVDANYGCVKFIEKMTAELEFDINTFRSDVFEFLKKTPLTADVIFADPPYDLDDSKFIEVVDIIFERNLLNEDGLLVVEHSKHTDLSIHENFTYSKKYGGNMFSFFEALESPESPE